MTTARHAAVAALATAVVVVAAILLLAGQSSYTLHADFLDAGQLVTGDRVEVYGVPVGTITHLGLTADGIADVTLSISDTTDTPLHAGTRAFIRSPGMAGVANRYVDLAPGPLTGPTLPSGSTLGTDDTTGIVDIDEFLDGFNAPTRTALQGLIGHSAQLFAGSGAAYFRRLLAELSPALAQTSSLTGQLSEDRVGLEDLIRTAEVTATAIASRDRDLEDALSNSAQALSAVAREQQPFGQALDRLPAVLRQGSGTLAQLRQSIGVLDPTLKLVPAAAHALTPVLTTLVPTARRATPVIAEVRDLLPSLETAIRGLGPLRSAGVPALRDTTTALSDAHLILTGLRYYAADFLLGVTNGLGGIATGNYDENGHYARVEFVNAPQTGVSGLLQTFIPQGSLIPNEFGVRDHLTARCPGGDAPPAPDGSNPWILSSFWCTPSDDVPLSVDFP
jgi:phospholipid/cholesterol/gamma-HCH transport system substrate-binding protein